MQKRIIHHIEAVFRGEASSQGALPNAHNNTAAMRHLN